MNRKTRLPAALLAAAVALIAAVFPLLSVKYGSIAAEPAYSATEQLPRLYESAARRTANRTAPKLSAKNPSANSEFYNEHDLNAALSFLETADSNGVKNGTKLWADYDANDPETWISVGWTEDGRLSIFDADFSSHLAIQSNVADEVGPVGELDLSGCEMLGSVSLVSTCVERLDVSDCPNLFLVSAFYDELKSIDLSGCSSLYFLWVCYNKDLRQIDLSGLSELGALALSGNGLESLDFSSNPRITEIDCSNNSLTALDVSMLSELQSLRCENQDWEMPNSNRISEMLSATRSSRSSALPQFPLHPITASVTQAVSKRVPHSGFFSALQWPLLLPQREKPFAAQPNSNRFSTFAASARCPMSA